MRRMNFHDTKPRVAGATRCRSKRRNHCLNLILREGLWDSVPFRESQGTWSDHLMPAPLCFGYRPPPIPGPVRARLAPRVRELDAGHTTLLTDKVGDACERLNVVVSPDP